MQRTIRLAIFRMDRASVSSGRACTEKRKSPSLRCSFLFYRPARDSSGSAAAYQKAQRRSAQQRMLMRHMHMGIIMNIAVRDCIICAFSLPQEITKSIACHGRFVKVLSVLLMFFGSSQKHRERMQERLKEVVTPVPHRRWGPPLTTPNGKTGMGDARTL